MSEWVGSHLWRQLAGGMQGGRWGSGLGAISLRRARCDACAWRFAEHNVGNERRGVHRECGPARIEQEKGKGKVKGNSDGERGLGTRRGNKGGTRADEQLRTNSWLEQQLE